MTFNLNNDRHSSTFKNHWVIWTNLLLWARGPLGGSNATIVVIRALHFRLIRKRRHNSKHFFSTTEEEEKNKCILCASRRSVSNEFVAVCEKMDPTSQFFSKLRKLAVGLESETVRLQRLYEKRHNEPDDGKLATRPPGLRFRSFD